MAWFTATKGITIEEEKHVVSYFTGNNYENDDSRITEISFSTLFQTFIIVFTNLRISWFCHRTCIHGYTRIDKTLASSHTFQSHRYCYLSCIRLYLWGEK